MQNTCIFLPLFGSHCQSKAAKWEWKLKPSAMPPAVVALALGVLCGERQTRWYWCCRGKETAEWLSPHIAAICMGAVERVILGMQSRCRAELCICWESANLWAVDKRRNTCMRRLWWNDTCMWNMDSDTIICIVMKGNNERRNGFDHGCNFDAKMRCCHFCRLRHFEKNETKLWLVLILMLLGDQVT